MRMVRFIRWCFFVLHICWHGAGRELTMKRAAKGTARDSAEARANYTQLAHFGKASHVTMRGLTSVLRETQKEGIPAACSRRTLQRARDFVCSARTPFGPLVKTHTMTQADGTELVIGIQNPLAFIWLAAKHCEAFSELLLERLREHPSTPSSPWKLIVYQDGVNPGDSKAAHQTRNSVAYYWAFAEYGMAALCHEEVWGTPVVVRTAEAKKLSGKIAELTTLVLLQFFGENEADIAVTGITLNLHSGERKRIFAKVGVLLADEPALVEMSDSKGHQSHKSCCLCMNCTNHKPPGGGVPLHQRTDYAVPLTECNFSKFELHTDESMRAMLMKLRASKGVLDAASFADREVACGFNWNPHNMLLNERLNIGLASCIMYEWTHVTVSSGIADVEFGLFMKAMRDRRTDTTYDELAGYVKQWQCPKSNPSLDKLFTKASQKNNLKNASFSSSVSEFLTLAPILARWLACVVAVRGEAMELVRSMIAVLQVLELLQAVRRTRVLPELLRAAIEGHFKLFLLAWGEDYVRPKHHFALHLWHMLEHFGFLLATMTNERRHRLVKRYTRPRSGTQTWEFGVVCDITSHQMWEIKEQFLTSGRTESKPRPRMLKVIAEVCPGISHDSVVLHARVPIADGHASHGDVVLCRHAGQDRVGELLTSFSDGHGRQISLLNLWRSLPNTASSAIAHFAIDDSACTVVQTSSLIVALTFCMSPDGRECSVILPWSHRTV